MKIRNGYVSNSSSSSFVVISKEPLDKESEKLYFGILKNRSDGGVFIPFQAGECVFGWQRIKYRDFSDKLNWAILQALYAFEDLKNEKPMKLLKQFFREAGLTIDNDAIKDSSSAYIDHQSCCGEDSSQLAIFKSMPALKVFLFNRDSFIQCDNDNF